MFELPPTSPRRPTVLAGRSVPRIYPVSSKRADIHAYLCECVRRSGGSVIYDSGPAHAPVYLGLEDAHGRRLGLMIYPFRMTRRGTHNRPADEVRGQLRYGAEASWPEEDHFVARDVAGVDTTLLLGVYPEGDLLVGLDPALYDPLPLGISFYAKDAQVTAVQADSWTVWERQNHAGGRRAAPRAGEGLETMIGFSPERLLDYARFERQAGDLILDGPLRYAAAQDAAVPDQGDAGARPHSLEENFDLTSHQILDIIHTRMRLEVAVKGGVAEHHLERYLRADAAVTSLERLDEDAKPDFRVGVARQGGQQVLIECKNASPEPYKNGDWKVEIQKTRASKNDPAGRLYRCDQFDVVAACLYSPTRRWDFRYIHVSRLSRHETYPERLAATHRIDHRWATSLELALDDASHSETT